MDEDKNPIIKSTCIEVDFKAIITDSPFNSRHSYPLLLRRASFENDINPVDVLEMWQEIEFDINS